MIVRGFAAALPAMLFVAACANEPVPSPLPFADAGEVCAPACAVGEKRCLGDSVQACQAGPRGCATWTSLATCGALETCVTGACVGAFACREPCPAGTRCGPEDACVPDDPRALDLEVRATRVSGRVVAYGRAPTVDASVCARVGAAAIVWFEEQEREASAVALAVPCEGADFAFDGFVPPGRYRVRVENGRPDWRTGERASSLPCAPTVYAEDVRVGESAMTLTVDVQGAADCKVRVEGRVLRDGAPPVLSPVRCPTPGSPGPAARVRLTPTALWTPVQTSPEQVALEVALGCDNAAFTYAAELPPGTYVAEVELPDNPPSGVGMRGTFAVVSKALRIDAPVSNLALDVRRAPIAGRVTVNGALPAATAACQKHGRAVGIRLRESSLGYEFRMQVPCDDPTFSFAGTVYPGEYEVSVDGRGSTLPAAGYILDEAITVAAGAPLLTIDVPAASLGGLIKLNGGVPHALDGACANAGDVMAVVRFTREGGAQVFEAPVPCSAQDFRFGPLDVLPGRYTAVVESLRSSDLPLSAPATPRSFEVRAPAAQVDLDVFAPTASRPLLPVSGFVLLNGAVPAVSADCDIVAADVEFEAVDLAASDHIAIPCDTRDFGFVAMVPAGTYRVRVLPWAGLTGPRASTLPPWAWEGRLEVAGPVANALLDVQTVEIGGRVRLSGAAPEIDVDRCRDAAATVALRDIRTGASFPLEVPCGAEDLSFSGELFPGVYEVSVSGASRTGTGQWTWRLPVSDLPIAPQPAIHALELR